VISRNDELSASELDALVPRHMPAISLRALPTEQPAALPALPLFRRPLTAKAGSQQKVSAPPIDPRVRAYWADPQRTFWTPLLAGAALSLWELESDRFPMPWIVAPSALLVSGCLLAEKEMDDVERGAVAELAQHGVTALRALWPESRVLAELGLDGSLSLAERRAALEERLATIRQPVEWLTVLLPAALLFEAHPVREFLTAGGQYRGLGARVTELAERQGLTTWEEGVRQSIGFWGDPRGRSVLKALLATPRPGARPSQKKDRSRPAGSSRQLRKLDAKLAEAKEAAATARAEAEARRERLAAAQREAAEARQSRDRVAERLRKAEAELEALRALVPQPKPSATEPDAALVQSTTAEPATPDKIPETELDPATVLAGRRVYLYTGIEREAAREAMARALEEHGAVCEVFDGNSLGQLGPSRFPADALVIIETSHLCHNGNNIVLARARASGAWCFQGKAGSGSLARRVAERWWMTHPGEDQRQPA
jgi:hypothetical protein